MEGAALKIWVTRAEPGAWATAERLRSRGHEPVVAPLLTVEPIPDPQVDLRGVGALAFTSANGVRAFAGACPERALRVFAVGSATASAAKAAGFKAVLSAEGDVAALAERIAARAREIQGSVLHPGALEPAGDLVGALRAAGMEARLLPLYDTVPSPPPDDFLAAIGDLDLVLLHSPKAARTLAKVLRKHPAPQLVACCLSPAVLKPLSRARLAGKVCAPIPIEAALLNLIDRRA